MNLETLTLQEQIEGLREKKFSSVELVKNYISVIEDKEDLNIFVSNDFEKALEKAKKSDGSKKSQEDVPLNGIPMVHKDIFCTKGIKTSCGSKMLDNFYPPYSATVVEKLEHAGSICLGKANMDEFAMGSSNETSFYGAVKNPLNIKKTPGGSSGGSAAAVAANFSSFSTGTDTGGSIRQPASFCGIAGIKPTYGRVSRYGMIAFASSLDQGGILAKNIKDAAIALQYISGYDPKDATSIKVEVPNFSEDCESSEFEHVVGLVTDLINSFGDEDLSKNYGEAIERLEKLKIKTKEIELPNLELSLPVYYVIAPAECSANLSRYDGIRFGYRAENVENLEDLYFKSRGEGFGNETKKRILIGTYCLSSGFYDAYYKKAQKIRNLISSDFVNAFKDVTSVMLPTTSGEAFDLGSITDPVEMYKQDIFTIPANLGGLPATSVPFGEKNNMPLGIQFIGNILEESSLLNISNKFQLGEK